MCPGNIGAKALDIKGRCRPHLIRQPSVAYPGDPEMKALSTLFAIGSMFGSGAAHADQVCPTILDVEVRRLASDERVNLCQTYRGQVILIVNTASKCGFTGQYEGLEALYAKYKDRGFVVLGFPSNDFMGQEPGTEAQIKDFCRLTYSVQFPMFEKSQVAKGEASPLFQRLAEAGGGYPRWNFYKYLLDREGKLVDSWSSFTGPQSPKLVEAIERAL
jgi:glutathione peroxidase